MLCTVGVVQRQPGRYQPNSASTFRLCRLGATGFDASAAASHCVDREERTHPRGWRRRADQEVTNDSA